MQCHASIKKREFNKMKATCSCLLAPKQIQCLHILGSGILYDIPQARVVIFFFLTVTVLIHHMRARW